MPMTLWERLTSEPTLAQWTPSGQREAVRGGGQEQQTPWQRSAACLLANGVQRQRQKETLKLNVNTWHFL